MRIVRPSELATPLPRSSASHAEPGFPETSQFSDQPAQTVGLGDSASPGFSSDYNQLSSTAVAEQSAEQRHGVEHDVEILRPPKQSLLERDEFIGMSEGPELDNNYFARPDARHEDVTDDCGQQAMKAGRSCRKRVLNYGGNDQEQKTERTPKLNPDQLTGLTASDSRSQEFEEQDPAPCSSSKILVSGIEPKLTQEMVTMYFENVKRSGGGRTQNVTMLSDEQKAIIEFDKPEGMLTTGTFVSVCNVLPFRFEYLTAYS